MNVGGATCATGKLARSYVWGLDVASSLTATGGVGALVLETVHSDAELKTYHVSYDGNGNVTALVNRATGAVAAAYEYGPFGENVRTQVFDESVRNQPFRFSTKFTEFKRGGSARRSSRLSPTLSSDISLGSFASKGPHVRHLNTGIFRNARS